MNILLMMSGSIACAKASALISLWTKAGHQVKIVCSPSVFEFIGKATLEGLSNTKVHSSVFAQDAMMEHIHLSRWADKIILAPATANTINKLVAGIADDMLSTTWIAALALNKPMIIAPAMNGMMWHYPATQNSIKVLQSWGVQILFPQTGALACGENGAGRLMEVEAIDKALFANKKGKKVLITAGGTREYIDGVRYIGNLSTGKTAAQIADYFTSHGDKVTWLGAINAIKPSLSCTQVSYETFDELSKELEKRLKEQHFDCIIHAAAISDFGVAEIKLNHKKVIASRQTKLPTCESMDIKLKKNPKLVAQLRNWSKNLDIKVIAFKLTNTADKNQQKQAVTKLLKQDGIDWVAHNDLADITATQHPFALYSSTTKPIVCENVTQLCRQLNLTSCI